MAEAALVESLKAGNPDAFETLVREHAPRMLAVARRFMRNEEDAQDAVQDAFLSVHKAIGRFDGNAKLSTWLHRIVANACLMKLRTKRRKPETSIEEFLPDYLDDGHLRDRPQPWPLSAEQFLEAKESRELVRDNIDQLPGDFRNVLLLRDIEGMDTAETAKLLGISTGAVKTRLHRARMALRNLLDPYFRQIQE
ncbi:MAG: RNA polymerase sigma factor [Planctomycetota bacterium]|jgi:RNA polymerase sigma-70 factor (ECF subfamily)